MKAKIKDFKLKLSRVFDDSFETVQWKNYVDYIILGLILLSTIEVFLSTYDNIVERFGEWLHAIDLLTTIVFTIEVTLRIWCADLIDEKYKGFLGRIRYCVSFYGLIDILSTYTYVLTLFFPINYTMFKSLRMIRLLRVLRLFRIFRFMRSVRLLGKAMKQCKTEMMVSLQFLCIVTLIMSFVLFFVEHEAQPDVYKNGWTSVLWAFAQYIGDPGSFADTPPITSVGHVIAFMVGILGVAIFAVPAGLIGSAFTDVMAEEKHEEYLKEWTEKLHLAFERKLNRPTGFQIAPPYVSVVEVQARLGLKDSEIFDVVAQNPNFRLINLSCTQPADLHPQDKLAVEHYVLNTPYGCCINRGSKVTIFSPSNIVDPVMGWWGYYLAKIGGFNFISREIGVTRPYTTFYQYKPEKLAEHQDEFMNDLNRLASSEDSWVLTVMPASGADEPTYPTQFHFTYGAKKGDETYDNPNITLNDVPSFDALYKTFAKQLEDCYGLSADKQRYHANSAAAYFARHLTTKVNAVALRVAWSVICWDMRAIQIARDLAETINQTILHTNNPVVADMTVKDIAYDGYVD